MEAKKNKYKAQDFYNLFAGLVPANILPYIVAQVAHETADFNSRLLYDHNNATGITFANKPKLQKNAIKGRPLPEAPQYNYAKFASLNDWAVDYLRLINRGKNKPLEALTIEDYVARLKANKFFTDTVERYTAGVKRYLKKYGKIKPVVTGGAITLLLIIFAVVVINK
jgi:hypothetical protein